MISVSRRGFFKTVVGTYIGSRVAPPVYDLVPVTVYDWKEVSWEVYGIPQSGTLGAINRASYRFWRNENLKSINRDLFEDGR